MTLDWVEQDFIVGRELGLHARPSGELVTQAATFASEIEIGCNGEWVSGRSVLSILSLAATQGTRLTVRCRGADAKEAIRAMGAVIEAEND
jgi:phosphocarrier protein HPr